MEKQKSSQVLIFAKIELQMILIEKQHIHGNWYNGSIRNNNYIIKYNNL
jgi:hypothetical protein